MQKTYTLTTADVTRSWVILDAKDAVLGRFATQVATKLIGKHKKNYTPHIDGGDYVIVVNASEIAVTGSKMTDKTYIKHSNFPGGFKTITFDKLLAKAPEEIIRKAVYNMLPKNKLRDQRMNRLKVYASSEHPHNSQIKE